MGRHGSIIAFLAVSLSVRSFHTRIMPTGKAWLVWCCLVILFVCLDQAAKYMAFAAPARSLVVGNLYQFRNDQFAFSIPLPPWLILLVYALVLAVMGYEMWKYRYKRTGVLVLAEALVCAGAFSNIADRIALGYVRDFFNLATGYINSADVCIIAGVLLLALLPRADFQ